MKHYKLFYFLPLLLVGCNYPIHGDIETYSELTIRDHGKNEVNFDPGKHHMEVRVEPSFLHEDKAILNMKIESFGKDHSLKARTVKVYIPESTPNLEQAGTFELSSSQTGQPFDLSCQVEPVVQEGEVIAQERPCDCYSNFYGIIYCDGVRTVKSQSRETFKRVTVDFKTSGTQEVKAHFMGSTESVLSTVIREYGDCRRGDETTQH